MSNLIKCAGSLAGTIVMHERCPHCKALLEVKEMSIAGVMVPATLYGSCGCPDAANDCSPTFAEPKHATVIGLPGRYAEASCELGDLPDRVASGESFYFFGPHGTGKTYCAAALARQLADTGIAVRFEAANTLVHDLQSMYSAPGLNPVERATQCDALIIDDIGRHPITHFVVDALCCIVDKLYNERKPLILTSNYELEKLMELFEKANPEAAATMFPRMCEDMTLAPFDGPNLRTAKHAKQQAQPS